MIDYLAVRICRCDMCGDVIFWKWGKYLIEVNWLLNIKYSWNIFNAINYLFIFYLLITSNNRCEWSMSEFIFKNWVIQLIVPFIVARAKLSISFLELVFGTFASVQYLSSGLPLKNGTPDSHVHHHTHRWIYQIPTDLKIGSKNKLLFSMLSISLLSEIMIYPNSTQQLSQTHIVTLGFSIVTLSDTPEIINYNLI